MKKKRITSVLASIAVFATVAAAVPMNAGAYDTLLGSTSAPPIDKHLVMDIDANAPNASFEFDIEKFDSTKAEGALYKAAETTNDIDVFNGVVGSSENAVTYTIGDTATNTMTFSPADTSSAVVEGTAGISNEIAWNDTGDGKIGNEKCVSKSIVFDFSKVKFPTPGVYRYLITEKPATSNKAIRNDISFTTEGTNTYRTLDVLVRDYKLYYDSLSAEGKEGLTAPDPSKEELIVLSYVFYAGKYTDGPKGAPSEGVIKSDSFTNKYTTYDLTIGKDVTGNQASKDKYFAVTVSISGAVAGTKYDVSYADDGNDFTTDGSNAETTVSPNSATTCFTAEKSQPTSLTVGTDGTVSQVFYLKHGQRIAIRGIAETTAYTVTEANEDYSASVTPVLTASGETISGTSYEINDEHNSVAVSKIVGDNSIVFTNTKTGILPTGILVSVAGPAVVGVIALLGIAVLLIRGKRRKAEEE